MDHLEYCLSTKTSLTISFIKKKYKEIIDNRGYWERLRETDRYDKQYMELFETNITVNFPWHLI